MNLDKYEDVKDPKHELSQDKYLEWFLSRGWEIKAKKYEGELRPHLIYESGTHLDFDIGGFAAIKEHCALSVIVKPTEEGVKVKIPLNSKIMAEC